MGDLGLNAELGRSPGEGKGYLLQYSGLENSMDCIAHGVTESWTRLSDRRFRFHQSQKPRCSGAVRQMDMPVYVICFFGPFLNFVAGKVGFWCHSKTQIGLL